MYYQFVKACYYRCQSTTVQLLKTLLYTGEHTSRLLKSILLYGFPDYSLFFK